MKRLVLDEERTAPAEMEALDTQLDEWRVPRKTIHGRLTTLGRVRLMRNQAIEIVHALRAENARLKRLMEEAGVDPGA